MLWTRVAPSCAVLRRDSAEEHSLWIMKGFPCIVHSILAQMIWGHYHFPVLQRKLERIYPATQLVKRAAGVQPRTTAPEFYTQPCPTACGSFSLTCACHLARPPAMLVLTTFVCLPRSCPNGSGCHPCPPSYCRDLWYTLFHPRASFPQMYVFSPFFIPMVCLQFGAFRQILHMWWQTEAGLHSGLCT